MLAALCAAAEGAPPDGGTPAYPTVELPARVDAIEVHNLWITREFVVRRELPFKEGDVVTAAQWELARARLGNTELFSKVELALQDREGEHVAVITVEDRFTLNPLFSFGVGGGQFWVRAGADDVNLIGRFIELGLRYERFGDYNGFQAWVRDPRLLGKRLDGLLLGEWLFRPRPTYLLRRLSLRGEVYGESGAGNVRVGVFAQGVNDESFPIMGSAEAPPPYSRALQLGAMFRVGRVDLERIQLRGYALEVWPSVWATTDVDHRTYFQLFAQAVHYTTFGKRWNLAFRAQVGMAPGARVQDRYYLGGLDPGTPPTSSMLPYASGIRGYDDGFVRTEYYASFNGEVRFTVFDFMWLALMPAVFVDAAAAVPESGRGVVPMLSGGFGIRLLSPRLVRTGVRLDLAVPLVGTRVFPSPSFGVYQFF
jgi:outer membrane protein assembly factor BamA